MPHSDTGVATLFLKDKCDIYARHDKDQTLLNTAAYFNNAEVAKLLLEYNVDTEARDEIKKNDSSYYYTLR